MKVNAAVDAVKRLMQRLLLGAEINFDIPALAVKSDQFVGETLLHKNMDHENLPVFTGQSLFARLGAIVFAFAFVFFA